MGFILNGKEQISCLWIISPDAIFAIQQAHCLQNRHHLCYHLILICVLHFYDVNNILKGLSISDLERDSIFSLIFVLAWKYLLGKYVNCLVPSIPHLYLCLVCSAFAHFFHIFAHLHFRMTCTAPTFVSFLHCHPRHRTLYTYINKEHRINWFTDTNDPRSLHSLEGMHQEVYRNDSGPELIIGKL